MKISKKILTAFMCGLIAIGGSQATSLIKADASQIPDITPKQGERWRVGMNLKLRAKYNKLYHQWRRIDLVCRDNGSLFIDKVSTIPRNMTFDDTFLIGFNDEAHAKNGVAVTKLPFWLSMNIGGDTDAILADEINDFNAAGVQVTDPLYIHGRYWDDTVTFCYMSHALQNCQTRNDYTRGYKSVNRWDTGFWAENDGLHECVFRHDEKGVGNEPYNK